MELVAKGETNVTILTRSLHSKWEDNAINFWFDFVFSITDYNIKDPELTALMSSTRSKLKEKYKPDDIIAMASKASPRAARLLASEDVREVLSKKIESW